MKEGDLNKASNCIYSDPLRTTLITAEIANPFPWEATVTNTILIKSSSYFVHNEMDLDMLGS